MLNLYFHMMPLLKYSPTICMTISPCYMHFSQNADSLHHAVQFKACATAMSQCQDTCYIYRLTLACPIYIFIFTGAPVALTYWYSGPGFEIRCRRNLFNRDGVSLHTAFYYQSPSVQTWLKYFWEGRKNTSHPFPFGYYLQWSCYWAY